MYSKLGVRRASRASQQLMYNARSGARDVAQTAARSAVGRHILSAGETDAQQATGGGGRRGWRSGQGGSDLV